MCAGAGRRIYPPVYNCLTRNQLEKLEAAKAVYLCLPFLLPLLTFAYLSLPFLPFPYLSFPFLTFPYLSLPYLTFPYLSLALLDLT